MQKQRVRLLHKAAENVRQRRRTRSSSARISVGDFFRQLAQHSANVFGSGWAFLIAVVVVLVWAGTGPVFGYSDTWQLVINTGTTIVTFLMVFLIQNAQNRDAKALHLKLDELIHSIRGARNNLMDLENCTDAQLEDLSAEFARLATRRQAKRHQ